MLAHPNYSTTQHINYFQKSSSNYLSDKYLEKVASAQFGVKGKEKNRNS